MVNDVLNISFYDFAKNYCCFNDETGIHQFNEFQLSRIMKMQEMSILERKLLKQYIMQLLI